jgi:CubicO group peptidase (beta-lactamase class C family)
MQDRIFGPLGMKSAGFGPVALASSEATNTELIQVPWGHRFTPPTADPTEKPVRQTANYEPIQIDNAPPLGPAGRVHLKLQDWSKFALLFCKDEQSEKLGVTDSIKHSLLTTTNKEQYAGGWQLLERDWASGRVLYHNGSNTTWYADVFVAPDKGFCLMAATNCASPAAAPACDAAVQALLKLDH